MKVELAVLSFLSLFLAAGCLGPAAPGTAGDEDAEEWDGSLYAYRMHSVTPTWDEEGRPVPMAHTLRVVPSPGAPEARASTCAVINAPNASENVTCRIAPPDGLSYGNGELRRVENGCATRHASGEAEMPAYEPAWMLVISWKGEAAPDISSPRDAFAEWRANVESNDSRIRAQWNGTVSPCFQASHTDAAGRPPITLIDWTWQASDHTLLDERQDARVELPEGNWGCLLLTVQATTDEFGYDLRLLKNEVEMWRTHEEVSMANTTPRMHDAEHKVFNGYNEGDAWHIEVGHPSAPPPEPQQAQTEVHVLAVEAFLPDCTDEKAVDHA